MKKYFISLLLIVILNSACCFGQKKIYKNVDTLNQYDNAQIIIKNHKADTVFYPNEVTVIKVDVMNIYNGEVLPTPDLSKYYWKKQVYWEGKMNAELDRLNRTGHVNDISKNLVRFQDSAIFYKLKLEKYKSK